MNPEIQLLVSVWDALKNYIPKKDRTDAAEHVFRVFDEESDMSGIEDATAGLDSALISAIKSHYGFDDDDDEYEWE